MPTKICPDCGGQVSASRNECPHCGHYFAMANTDKNVQTIVCSQCGSGDTTKVSQYTFKCNRCGTIIEIPRPDVHYHTHSTNINIGHSSNNAPPQVLQVKETLTEKQFIRKCLFKILFDENISIEAINKLNVDHNNLIKAYITYFDSNLDSKLGFNLKSLINKKLLNDFKIPHFKVYSNVDFIQFTNTKQYPLQRKIVSSLNGAENNSQSVLVDSSEIKNYYYVPCFNLTIKIDNKKCVFAGVANSRYGIDVVVKDNLSESDSTILPSISNIKKSLTKDKLFYSIFSISLTILAFLAFVIFLITAIVWDWTLIFPCLLSFATGVVTLALFSKFIDSTYINSKSEYYSKKLNAIEDCLKRNGLHELFVPEKTLLEDKIKPLIKIKQKKNLAILIILLVTTLLSTLPSILINSKSTGVMGRYMWNSSKDKIITEIQNRSGVNIKRITSLYYVSSQYKTDADKANDLKQNLNFERIYYCFSYINNNGETKIIDYAWTPNLTRIYYLVKDTSYYLFSPREDIRSYINDYKDQLKSSEIYPVKHMNIYSGYIHK